MEDGELIIFFEGSTDRDFLDKFIIPLIKKKYRNVEAKTINESSYPKIKSIIANAKIRQIDYIFITDLDNEKCLVKKKEKLAKKFGEDPTNNEIVIVCYELESWLYAGLGKNGCNRLALPYYDNTDGMTKEKFYDLGGERNYSKVKMKSLVKQEFKIKNAIKCNNSFRYFYEKYLPEDCFF